MYILKYADYEGTYHGFNLKPGFYYGQDTETGCYIATSGWECNENVYIYFLKDGKWEAEWVDILEKFQISNVPEIDTKDKMDFYEWLKEDQGITWEYFDNNYGHIVSDEMMMKYDRYLYDGLPEFVILRMDKMNLVDCLNFEANMEI